MIIKSLVLSDFRAYSGVHQIELMPRLEGGEQKPVVIIGGLNGAGKTSILIAIRLALYGHLAMDLGTTKESYREFIRESIHDDKVSILKKNSTYIELAFLHGKIGEQKEYVVRRNWYDSGTDIKEHLSISIDKVNQNTLSFEAIQGLLNDLVPIGVSNLFFFDGERISDLAKDGSERVLRAAFDRLYGLDLIERLRTDLRVYLLRQQKKLVKTSELQEIEESQTQFRFNLEQISSLKAELANVRDKKQKLQSDKDLLEAQMLARGGEWGVSREEQKKKALELTETLNSYKRELRDHLSGVFPLSLVSGTLADIFDSLSESFHSLTNSQRNTLLQEFSSELGQRLDDSAKCELSSQLEKWIRPVSSNSFQEDLSISLISRLDRIVNQELQAAKAKSTLLVTEINKTSEELDDISRRIEQAPDEAVLAEEFSSLAELDVSLKEIEADIEVRINELKHIHQRAIDLARQLRNKHLRISEKVELESPISYANVARQSLIEFRRARAEIKLNELETEFTNTFNRLMRKDHYIQKSRIDSEKYSVELVHSNGEEIKKSTLSEGEKQIFAISMLDALAKTSKHKLPVVIDTPLARLDSHHRTNLITDYFSRASHQVILLSTDKEIDVEYLNQLLPLTSHCLEVSFDSKTRSSSISEGYFWSVNGGSESDSAQN